MSYLENKHEPIVYYMAHLQYKGAVKIGTTVNETSRIYRFRKKRKDSDFFVLAREAGDASVESARHREFANLQVSGDWFFLTGELLDHIRYLVAVDYRPNMIGAEK